MAGTLGTEAMIKSVFILALWESQGLSTWGVGVGGLLAEPWEERKSKGGGQSQRSEHHPCRSVDNQDHREVPPPNPAAHGGPARCRVQGSRPGTLAQQLRHRPHRQLEGRKLGKSPQQDGREI